MTDTDTITINLDTVNCKFEMGANSIEDKAFPNLISKIGRSLERIPSYRRPPIKTFEYGMEPVDWLLRYQERAKRSGWVHDKDKLSNVKDFLDERAALWLINGDIKTWNDFVIKFRHTFQVVYDVKIIDQAIKDASIQMKRIYDLEKKHHTVFKKKLGGYTSMFIMNNVIGFIPAVLSCSIPENYIPIFGTNVFKVSSDAQEVYESYKVFVNKANELKDSVLSRSFKIKDAKDVIDKDLTELQAKMLPFLKPIGNLKIIDKWLHIEKKIQWITGGLSALTVIILIYSISKSANMNILDAERILYAVWIFLFSVVLIIYKQPEHELDLMEERYGHGIPSPLAAVTIV
ncbi:unnamed protein product [Cunninghamella echinulata]